MYETLRPVPLIEERKQLRRRSMASFRTIPVEIQTDIIELLLPNERCPYPGHGYHYNSSPKAVPPERISETKSQFQAIVLACPSAVSVVVRACRKRVQDERALLNRKGLKECDLYPREYQEYRDMHSVQPDALDLLCRQMERLAKKLEKSRAKVEAKLRKRQARLEQVERRARAKLEKAQIRAELKNIRVRGQLVENRREAELEARLKQVQLEETRGRALQPVRQSLRVAALAAASWKKKKQS